MGKITNFRSFIHPASLFVLLLFMILPGPLRAQSQQPFWTGEGGRGTRVTVAEPTGTGLSLQEESLLPLVQSTVIGAFQRFSAMTVFDRQNLENILEEQRLVLGGYFSDDDFIRIGQLTQARYVVFGSIHRIAGNYMLELAVTNVETGERRASYPPRPVSLFALQDLSAIREASANLLGQLGVNLTASGLQELRRAEDTARIQAENELARGIAAQRQGLVAEALAYYFRAAAFNPALGEVVRRVSVVSAGISTGNLGQNIRNRMHEYDSWRAILEAAGSFYSDHLPYEFEYNIIPKMHRIDFARRTADLSIEISLAPTDAWNTINDLRAGFRRASRYQWAHVPLQTQRIISPRQIEITMQILNENGVVLSTASYTFTNPSETARLNRELFFRDIRADDITAQFVIRVVSINGIPPERAGETGFIQITSTDQAWRMDVERTEREIEAARRAQARAAEARGAARAARRQNMWINASRSILDVSLFYAWEGGDGSATGLGMGIGGFFSPVPFLVIGAEGRFADLITPSSRDDDVPCDDCAIPSFHVSFAPALGVVFPLGNGWIFANAFFEMGTFGHLYGLIADWATPSFEAGLEFEVPSIRALQNGTFCIRYRHTRFRGSHTHVISIGVRIPLQ